jgi:parallel beta-helix repeat protein
VIRGNTCAANGNGAGNGAGIHALLPGGDNRIEGNNCTGADRGIDVDTAGNIVFRNTCAGNTTNWDVAAGNVCLVVQAVTGAAILGNSGGASPGASDPIANYTY